MEIKFLKRNFFQRILGLPATPKPADDQCWRFAEGKLTIDMARTPELKAAGGALRFEGKNLPKRVLVITEDGQTFHAFHNRCTHAGHRRLDPVPGMAAVQCCSVGKSTYDLSGKNIFGPAPESIKVFFAEVSEDQLIVTVE